MDFPEKYLFGLRWGKRDQSGVFSSFLKIFLLLFPGINLKWKALQFFGCLCKPHISKDSGSQVIGQNTLIKSGYRVLWLLISLELMDQFLWFSRWWYLSRKDSMWNYYFWMDVSRHGHPHPNVLKIIRGSFG